MRGPGGDGRGQRWRARRTGGAGRWRLGRHGRAGRELWNPRSPTARDHHPADQGHPAGGDSWNPRSPKARDRGHPGRW